MTYFESYKFTIVVAIVTLVVAIVPIVAIVTIVVVAVGTRLGYYSAPGAKNCSTP